MKIQLAVALLMTLTGAAAADGERTPMVGGALTFSEADHRTELVGGQLELAWWLGRFGLAAEGAARRAVDDDNVRNLSVAGSARVLVTSWMWPSLFEPRDVELAVELQALAERTWWSRDDRADALGLGAAIRMRGGSDWEFSELIAESRLFVRVMKSRDDRSAVSARVAGPMTGPPEPSGMTVTVGLGVAFGAGSPRYLERFRWRGTR